MATNRKRRTRKPRQVTPAWAVELIKTGQAPERDTEAWNVYIGWKYFDEQVPGLPSPHEVFKDEIDDDYRGNLPTCRKNK